MNGSYSNGDGHGGEGGLLGLKQPQDLSPIYTNNKHHHHHQQPEHECGYNGGVSQDTALGVHTCDLIHDNNTAGTHYQ